MNTSIAQVATQDLIPVFQADIGGVMTNACDARTLHKFLGVGRDFSNWIKDRIAEYGFTIEQDYTCIESLSSPKSASTKARPQKLIDYHLALNMGKELSMVEKNDKGRQARKYFINCERIAIEALSTIPYGLKALPLKKTKIAVEGGLSLATQDELKNMIHDLAATLPKDKQASAVIGMWSALGTHFEAKALKGDSKLAAYKFIPEAARLECVSLLARLPFNDMVTLSNTDMMALIDSRVHEQLKALPAPAPLEGEMLQKPQHNKISFDLAPLRAGESRRWLITQLATEAAMFHPLLPGQQVVSMDEAVKLLQQHDYLVVKKSELLGKLEA